MRKGKVKIADIVGDECEEQALPADQAAMLSVGEVLRPIFSGSHALLRKWR
jgi:hypothetical protein